MAKIKDKLMHAWNAFTDKNDQDYHQQPYTMGASYGSRPDRVRLYSANERSIINSVIMRIAIDVAAVKIRHIKHDENDRFLENVNSGLNNCLTLEANLDQGASAFRQDLAMTLFDKGVIAVVPVETSLDPTVTGGYDIKTLRIGEVVGWFPKHVMVSLYNDLTGLRQEIILPKSIVAIIENPLYSVLNEPNSTLQRLIRKLNLLDAVDEASSSGKLDLIIQLPYVIKSDARRAQADARRKEIEFQMTGSKYGIAYTDGTEKITQLNRPTENNLLTQIEFLTNMLYSQLGVTKEVFEGTADEKTMLNYYNRTIDPVLRAISEGMKRTFLTKTARSQSQSIEYFRDPFTLVAVSALAEIADKFTRNEILTSNEVRGIIGYKPAADPKAEELRNKNLPQEPSGSASPSTPGDTSEQDKLMEETLTALEAQADKLIADSSNLDE